MNLLVFFAINNNHKLFNAYYSYTEVKSNRGPYYVAGCFCTPRTNHFSITKLKFPSCPSVPLHEISFLGTYLSKSSYSGLQFCSVFHKFQKRKFTLCSEDCVPRTGYVYTHFAFYPHLFSFALFFLAG